MCSPYSVLYLASTGSFMLTYLQNSLQLTGPEVVISLCVITLAGMVRGFSGFGQSAMIMSGLALIIPPATLIPICLLLEGVASLLMFRGGLTMADRKLAFGLAAFSIIGLPIGLTITLSVPTDISRTVALSLVLVLALLQLLRKSPTFFSGNIGIYVTGLLAGTASGLASAGGMVVALYVLSQNTTAAKMRASLVTYLLLTLIASAFTLWASGMLDSLVLIRAAIFAPFIITGVLLGTFLFRPSLQHFYKRFCLCLLMGLAAVGLVRLLLGF